MENRYTPLREVLVPREGGAAAMGLRAPSAAFSSIFRFLLRMFDPLPLAACESSPQDLSLIHISNRFFISKSYRLKEHRGEGLCSATIRFYERLARERGLDALYLTVNKRNEMAIRAYKAKGFEVIDAAETDIGDGYIMDDYIMEKKLQ